MPNLNAVIAQNISKGDVIWVPYRKDPMWPALVNNAYPKKVSYSFFPLAPGVDETKRSRFSCAPKLTYALVTTEPLPENANSDLKKAHRAACEYLSSNGKTRGSNIQSLGEAAGGSEKMKKMNGEVTKNKTGKPEKRKKKVDSEQQENEEDDEDLMSPVSKKPSSSERSTPSGSQQQPPITEEQSKSMMKMIDDRFEVLINEIWKSDEVAQSKNQTMKDKMTIKLKNNQFLKESDYDIVFERIFNFIRMQNPSLSFISTFNITSSHIIPHILITCYSACRNLDYQTSKEIFYQLNTRVLGLDSSMSIPVTDHLEELCRLACDESDAIQS